MSDILKGLNKAQVRAVTHNEGPIQVLSCAGSGKTRVITHRIAYLIQEHGIDPTTILAVTFTKKAATEMESRLCDLIGVDPLRELNVGTFHSACFRILRNEVDWYDIPMMGFSIMEEWKRVALLRDSISNTTLAGVLPLPAECLRIISRLKNELYTVDDLLAAGEFPFHLSQPVDVEAFAEAYGLYERHKRDLVKYDFDDLLLEVHRMFQQEEFIRLAYSGILDYFLVDEFQDTNKAQFEIIRQLCESDGNLMVVGDDDQSIYSWRGAVPQYTIQFTDYYPEAVVIRMETNYRSYPEIISTANCLITKNVNRLPKKAKPNRKGAGKVLVFTSPTEGDEAESVCQEIAELRDMNGEQSIAVLYRTNAQSRATEDALVHAGIPYSIVGSLGFYNRKEVKDILAYLRVVEFDDDEALLRVINRPSRYLGKVFVSEIANIAQKNDCSLFKAIELGRGSFSKPYMATRSKQFTKIIWTLREDRRSLTPADMVASVRDFTGYDEYISSTEVEGDPDDSRIQNLDELQNAAVGFSNLREFLTFTESMQARGSEASNGDDKENRVELLTLHRAKGLEWDIVFIIGVSEGILPHHRAESLEEERRLFYVGVTRTRNQLYLGALELYMGRPRHPSRFIQDAGRAWDQF